MQIATMDVVTNKGKIAKVNRVRDYSNEKRIVYKLRFVIPGKSYSEWPVLTIVKIDKFYVSDGDTILGFDMKLRHAMKIAASHAIDNDESIQPDGNRYSYSRQNGIATENDEHNNKRVVPVNRKAKRSRPIVFH